jgi:glutathione S-transferase
VAVPGAKRPVLLRIPFSHFCKKAEWGLTQAGIAYDTLDMSPKGRMQIGRVAQDGTVPVMLVDGIMIEGSDKILTWAAAHAAPGTDPLYPEALRTQVQEWEVWAGEAVGPVARREAYRVAYNHPSRLTRRRAVHMMARLFRAQVLGVLKYYKVRRFDDHDRDTVPKIVANVVDELRRQGTGFLVGSRPTAADVAVAALAQPFLYAEPARDYAALDGWDEFATYVRRVGPRRTTRRRRRWMTERRWRQVERALGATRREDVRDAVPDDARDSGSDDARDSQQMHERSNPPHG